MYYPYVLISRDGRRTYTRHTSDLDKRLQEHNEGNVISSKKFRPYVILHFENFETLKEAKQKELYYKTNSVEKPFKSVCQFLEVKSS